MNDKEAIKWLISLKDTLGKIEYMSLWNYEQALDEIILLLEKRTNNKSN